MKDSKRQLWPEGGRLELDVREAVRLGEHRVPSRFHALRGQVTAWVGAAVGAFVGLAPAGPFWEEPDERSVETTEFS